MHKGRDLMTHETNGLNAQNKIPQSKMPMPSHRNRSVLKKIIIEGSFIALIGLALVSLYLQCALLSLAVAIILLPLSILILWTLVSVSWTSFRHPKRGGKGDCAKKLGEE